MRFLAVGASNTAVSFLAYLVAYASMPQLPARAGASQAIAYAAGMLWSYLWNRAWVFGSRDRVVGESVRFFVGQVVLLSVSTLAIGVAVDRLGADHVSAWVVVMALVTILNYLVLRNWAFRGA